MSPGVDCHDAEARRDIADVRHELRNHKAVTDIKADNLKKEVDEKDTALKGSLDEIKSLMKWAGSLIITLIIGVLGWSLVQQYQANEQQKTDLEQQIRLLQEQERTRAIAQQNRAAIDQLTAGRSEAPLPANGGR
jgi:uncharacterized protein HemX